MAGAIGKLPDGLRPPPRLVRGETVTCGGFAATPRLLPQKEGDHPRQRMVEDILFPPQLCVSQQKGLSSVSLTADCSLCRGSLLAPFPAKPPLKGEVPAIGGRRGSFPQRQQVTNAPPLRRNHLCRKAQVKRQPLFGREESGGRGASLREAASPPSVPHPAVSSGREREGGELLYREAPLPRIPSRPSLIPSVPPRLGRLEPGT